MKSQHNDKKDDGKVKLSRSEADKNATIQIQTTGSTMALENGKGKALGQKFAL